MHETRAAAWRKTGFAIPSPPTPDGETALLPLQMGGWGARNAVKGAAEEGLQVVTLGYRPVRGGRTDAGH